MQLLIATHNPAKFRELKRGLESLEKNNLKIISLNDLKIIEEPVEDGETFEQNARIKAVFYAKKAGLPTICDDGGLIIEALNNEPGVQTKMWLGRSASDKELIDYTLVRMKGKSNRRAYFETCLCFYDPRNKIQIFEKERIRGAIAEKAHLKTIHGYPYRSVFIVKDLNKYYLELNEWEHEQINHRLKACRRLAEKIAVHLLK